MMLQKGETVTLVPASATDDLSLIPVDFEQFPQLVSPGSTIFLSDGFLQLRVDEVTENRVRAMVVIGGPLLSRKGLSLVGGGGILAVSALTDRDLECIEFGLAEGLDTFSISFIERAEDIRKAREHAARSGKSIRVIAKIERQEALLHLDEILREADGVMIARGDLGVQIPIEEVPSAQKRIIQKANILGRPVITATQMLMSMTDNIRPTRAEVTDVANAILDGTDAVMLSEETSIGKYPVETVAMMSKIARSTEEKRSTVGAGCNLLDYFRVGKGREKITINDVVSLNVIEALDALGIRFVLTPTRSGNTPRNISRFKPEAWILAFTRNPGTLKFLAFSYGVCPFLIRSEKEYWHGAILDSIRDSEPRGNGLAHHPDRRLRGAFSPPPGDEKPYPGGVRTLIHHGSGHSGRAGCPGSGRGAEREDRTPLGRLEHVPRRGETGGRDRYRFGRDHLGSHPLRDRPDCCDRRLLLGPAVCPASRRMPHLRAREVREHIGPP